MRTNGFTNRHKGFIHGLHRLHGIIHKCAQIISQIGTNRWNADCTDATRISTDYSCVFVFYLRPFVDDFTMDLHGLFVRICVFICENLWMILIHRLHGFARLPASSGRGPGQIFIYAFFVMYSSRVPLSFILIYFSTFLSFFRFSLFFV